MPYHAKRFLADLRGVRAWLVTVAVSALVLATITSYAASFGLDRLRQGTLSTDPPHEPLSFLRVVDPQADIVADLESLDDLPDQLRTPGMAVLLRRMNSDDRLSLVLPLQDVMHRPGSFPQEVDSGHVVVGSRPPLIEQNANPGPAALLWGSLPENISGGGRFGPIPFVPGATGALADDYVDGTGIVRETGREPMLWLTPNQVSELGVYPPVFVADLMSSMTCYCTAQELGPLARQMNKAERQADTGRTFYPVTYSGLIGPYQQSQSSTDVLLALIPAAAGLSVCAFAGIATLLLWRRREDDYAVERSCGAGETALHLRQQAIVALAITGPVVLGFLLADAALQSADPPPPWPPGGGPAAPLLALALHAAVGASAFVHVRRLCRPSSGRIRSA